jgi:hypothetical protein
MTLYKLLTYYQDGTRYTTWYGNAAEAKKAFNLVEKEYDQNIRRAYPIQAETIGKGGKALLKSDLAKWLNRQGVQ